jgi:plasmid stability protein
MEVRTMSTLTIRNFDESLKDRLRLQAATHGRSMEEETRIILRNALTQPSAKGGLGSRVHARFSALGGLELELPERRETAHAASFETPEQTP